MMNIDIGEKGSHYIACIDGGTTQTWDDFFKEIGLAFNFPEYYGHNLHAFRDCINDLSWIEQDNYILIINNSDFLLKMGMLPDDHKYLTDLFGEIADNWIKGPDAAGDDETRKVSKFIVIYN